MSETQRFTEDILTVAKEKSQSVINQAESDTQHALDEAKSRISREADDIVHNAKTEAESIKRRHMSEARHRLKLQEQQEKNKILSEVLDTTRKRVLEVVNNEPKYLPYLTGFVADGIRELGSDQIQVHLNEVDLKRIDKAKLEREIVKGLQKPVKIEWSKEPIVALGGAVVSTNDGRTRIVSTVDARFEALEQKLLIAAGKLLFGE